MTPTVVRDLAGLRAVTDRWRRDGRQIGLVPTMGNLHAGHLALVEAIRGSCDRVITSIFVNPTQFGPGEDYDAYPRTFEADLVRLGEQNCDLVWAPTVDVMYPLTGSFGLRVPAGLGETLCGAHRPGHFDGVASVVLRLFVQTAPDRAIFGEKDFQQLLVIRRMVEDFALPVNIDSLSTVREDDGLAMSSRNQYLTPSERAAAPTLHRVLSETASSLQSGQSWDMLRAAALEELEKAGFRPQYLEWRSAENLGAPERDHPQRLFAAAHLGKARLIDNILV